MENVENFQNSCFLLSGTESAAPIPHLKWAYEQGI